MKSDHSDSFLCLPWFQWTWSWECLENFFDTMTIMNVWIKRTEYVRICVVQRFLRTITLKIILREILNSSNPLSFSMNIRWALTPRLNFNNSSDYLKNYFVYYGSLSFLIQKEYILIQITVITSFDIYDHVVICRYMCHKYVDWILSKKDIASSRNIL